MVALALYQPDQAGNVGTLLRLGSCLGVDIHIIHPCGFAFSRQALRRSGMDYLDYVTFYEYDDYADFMQKTATSRKILLTTKAKHAFTDFMFLETDILLLGQESAGAPEYVHEQMDARLTIPMRGQGRSINMAVSASLVLSEALRQTNGFCLA